MDQQRNTHFISPFKTKRPFFPLKIISLYNNLLNKFRIFPSGPHHIHDEPSVDWGRHKSHSALCLKIDNPPIVECRISIHSHPSSLHHPERDNSSTELKLNTSKISSPVSPLFKSKIVPNWPFICLSIYLLDGPLSVPCQLLYATEEVHYNSLT